MVFKEVFVFLAGFERFTSDVAIRQRNEKRHTVPASNNPSGTFFIITPASCHGFPLYPAPSIPLVFSKVRARVRVEFLTVSYFAVDVFF